jgi:hypothetical protein
MKVSTEIDNNFEYEKITQLVDNIPLNEANLTSATLTRIILRPLSTLSLDEDLNSPCDKTASAA